MNHPGDAPEECWGVLDALDLAVVGIRDDGTIGRANQAARKLLGRSDLVGMPWADAVPVTDVTSVESVLGGGDERWSGPGRLVAADSRSVPIQLTVTACSDPADRSIAAVVVVTDQTEQLRADLDARRLASIVATAPDAIVSMTSSGRIVSWNPAAERLYGYSAGEAIGRSVLFIVPADRRGELKGLIPKLAAGEVIERFDTERLTRDGRRIEVQISVTPLIDNGSVVGATTIARDVTDRKHTEQELQRLAAIVDSSADAILSKTLEGIITSWNPAAERMYGYATTEAIGRHVSLLVPTERLGELRDIMTKVAAGAAVNRLETVRMRRDGRRIPVQITVWPLYDDDGMVVGASTVAHDMTARMRERDERTAAEMRFQAAFRRSEFGMVYADLEGRATVVNQAVCELLGRAPDELIGRTWEAYSHPDDANQTHELVATIGAGADSYSKERRYIRPDGSTVWVRANINLIRDAADSPLYLMGQLQDITERKRMEAELERRALHDPLTGLPNRTLLDDRLEHALAASERSGLTIGVIFLDLDNFKHVNDARSHTVGDRLLIEVGQRLLLNMRPGDTVARFGGDEFVLLCEDVTSESAARLAVRLVDALQAPLTIDGQELSVRASLGITVSRPGSTAATLLSEADAAMYRAKELGRGRAVLYEDSLRGRAQRMIEGERALRRGIEANEFVPYYQPIVDLTDGRIVGVEALARWQGTDGQVIAPNSFIPLAESTGLIVDLGRSILQQAATDVARWNSRAAGGPLWLSVNLSAHQLNPGLADMVASTLAASRLPAELLHLEITETVVMENIASSISLLELLKHHGVHLAIDDFGTGYSSLAYLHHLPVDTIKIDRSFISAGGGHEGNASIVEAIIALSRALRMTCVAEGVETTDQKHALIQLGCDLGQGFLWSRPLAAPEALKLTEGRGPSS